MLWLTFTEQSRVFHDPKKEAFENNEEKRENACNHQYILTFPQCFLA